MKPVHQRSRNPGPGALFHGAWRQRWTIRDVNDCPELDSSADFITEEVPNTDIDQDGRIEVTVPYRSFCGGGIEPATVRDLEDGVHYRPPLSGRCAH